jgi:hypothetical protein
MIVDNSLFMATGIIRYCGQAGRIKKAGMNHMGSSRCLFAILSSTEEQHKTG